MATVPKPPLTTQEPSTEEPKPNPPSATPASPPISEPFVPVVHVPTYSRWFSFDEIHKCEVRFLPEFFDSRSPAKNSRVYMYYRNSIVERYRNDFPKRVSFTELRRNLVGDVGSIRRVFDFLEGWGLINYTPPVTSKAIKWDDKEVKAVVSNGGAESGVGPSKEERTKRVCNHCKSICSIACFVCDKNNTTLCARCYVRGNYQIGDVNSSDFRRVEISEDSKTGWSDRDTLNLLEALMHYGDDWRRVSRHVNRDEKECVSHFLKLPFGEEFTGFADSWNEIKENIVQDTGNLESSAISPNKRICLTPLADASNPIMAQAAFLSALAGVDVAEAAARAAVTALTQADDNLCRESHESHAHKVRSHETAVAFDGVANSNATERAFEDDAKTQLKHERAFEDAKSQLEREEHDIERAIAEIVEVQMKEIKEKIDCFEALDLQTEKEWQQLEQIQNMLFADQLTLLLHKSSAKITGERVGEIVKID